MNPQTPNNPTQQPYPASPSPLATPSVAPQPESYDPPKQSRWKGAGFRSIASTLLLFLLAPIIAISVTAFMFQSYQVDGESMETTLQNRDRLIVDKIPRTWARLTHKTYTPHRGDIIVFNEFGLFDANNNAEKQLIKRVIGLPGDRVVIKDGEITIFNLQHPDGFNPDKLGLYTITATTTGDVDITLNPGEIYVCGDNRPNSADSRIFGPVKESDIVGKLVVRVFPLNKSETF